MIDSKNTSISTAFIIIVFSCMLLFLVMFWCNIPQICVPYKQPADASSTIIHGSTDSASCAILSAKIDSIQKVTNRIDTQYQQDIDTMINKMNTWVGYWMTLLTFILMIVSIWQFLNVRNIKDDYKEMKATIDNEMRVVSEVIDTNSSILQLQLSMRAINSLADSQLNQASNKADVKYCLDKLIGSLSSIENYIEQVCQGNNIQIIKDTRRDFVKLLPLMLVIVRKTLLQVKDLNRNIVDNIEFDIIQQNLAEFEKRIRPHDVVSESDKEDFHNIITRLSLLSDSLYLS